jgi:hypothetical protein
MIRTLRLPLAVLALACSALSVTASAQDSGRFSVYTLFTVDRMAGISTSPILKTLSPAPCTGAVTTNCTAYSDHVNPLGFTGGVSYDVKTIGPVTLVADLRGAVAHTHQGAQTASEGAGTRLYYGLGGVQARFHTPKKYLLPYVQGSFGYARSNYGVLTNAGVTSGGTTIYPGVATQNNFAYNAYAGLDLKLFSVASWRVFEAGYGNVQATGNYSHSYPVYSVSTGVVFYFPPRP